FFFSSRRRHTRLQGDWSSDVCSSDLPTGRHAAADEGRLLQRDVVVDLHDRVTGDDGALTEGAEHAHAADVLLPGVESEGAIREATCEQELAEVTEVLMAGGAPAALAARGQERADDVVAWRDVEDTVADLLDDAGAFVT